MRIGVIGAGIAGLSSAYELSKQHSVLVFEREFQPAYHATGRSSSISEVSYGGGAVNIATLLSQPFYKVPPIEISDAPLAHIIGELYLAANEKEAALQEYADKTMSLVHEAKLLRRDQINEYNPIIQSEKFAGAVYDPTVLSLDVGKIVESLTKAILRNGGRLITNFEASEILFRENTVTVSDRDQIFDVDIVINAAGAWADEIAYISGVPRIGLRPLRRTAVTVPLPDQFNSSIFPMIAEIDDEFYFKQDGASMLLCPSDESPSEPCDAQPETIDIALAIEKFKFVCGIGTDKILSKWAGLRTFSEDRIPVIGPAQTESRFFWCAGQGGYGVQTAPALSKMLAEMINGKNTGDYDLSKLDISAFCPARYSNS